MDKKNTMLLTVIAVATLLVAVVGATFAFFTATNSAGGETTVTTTTETVGAVAITNPTTAMHMTLAAADMTQDAAGETGKNFWATAGDGNYVTTAEHAPVSRVNITGSDADAETTYECSYVLKITKPSAIQAGDMAIILTLTDATAEGVTSGAEIDLYNAAESYTVNFTQVGNVTDKDLVTAAVRFTNKATAQEHLLSQNLVVKVENSSISCTVK